MENANYSEQTPLGFVDRLSTRKRRLMFELFLRNFPTTSFQTVLDIGVTADRTSLSSNYFERWFPEPHKIFALSNQAGFFLEKIYPGLRFMQGDARQLPFQNESIDVIFSSAVIEHIGSRVEQMRMIAECYRVARIGFFITTPNRWHPIEVHTLLPLLHWLPKSWHRKLLNFLGYRFYASEENLNLLDGKTIREMCQALSINSFSLMKLRAFGFVSHQILVVKK